VLTRDHRAQTVVGGIRTKHPDFGVVTGVVESGGRLWMGTIAFPAVAYTNVPAKRQYSAPAGIC